MRVFQGVVTLFICPDTFRFHISRHKRQTLACANTAYQSAVVTNVIPKFNSKVVALCFVHPMMLQSVIIFAQKNESLLSSTTVEP